MSHYIDLRSRVEGQKIERYRSLLVLADSARERSRQARQLAEHVAGAYLHLLDRFASQPQLAARIDRFGLDDLTDLFLNLEIDEEIVVVDAIDFLLNTWRSDQREAFVSLLLARRLDTLERGAKLFVFFALDDPYLRQFDLTNTRGESRIFDLSTVIC
jgi:hypothetical protein